MAIQSYRCSDTQRLRTTGGSQGFGSIAKVALRKLDMLNAAIRLESLTIPPGNRLEVLAGDRAGQHSIRINRQWRLCFVWTVAGPGDVEIVDYHG